MQRSERGYSANSGGVGKSDGRRAITGVTLPCYKSTTPRAGGPLVGRALTAQSRPLSERLGPRASLTKPRFSFPVSCPAMLWCPSLLLCTHSATCTVLPRPTAVPPSVPFSTPPLLEGPSTSTPPPALRSPWPSCRLQRRAIRNFTTVHSSCLQ